MSYNDSSLVKGGFEVALTLVAAKLLFFTVECGLLVCKPTMKLEMEEWKWGKLKHIMKLTVLAEVQPIFLNNFTVLLATFV